MEEEIINIATLTIDSEKALGTIEQTKKQIWQLQQSNSDLRKEIKANGDETGALTKQFVQQEAEIKNLNKTYATQQAAINDVTLAQVKESSALKESAKSIDQANQQNKELLKTRNQIDASTKEGAAAIKLLNEKMDENKKFILANANEQEKAAAITGNYRQKIFEASKSLDGFIPGLSQARTIVQGFGQSFEGIKSSLGDATDKVAGFTANLAQNVRTQIGYKASAEGSTAATNAQTTATEAQAVAQEASTVATTGTTIAMKALKVALIATGVGAIVILLVALFSALKNNEEASNKFSKSLAGFKGVINTIFQVLKPLGEFIADVLIKYLEWFGETVAKVAKGVASALNFLGFDKAAKSIDGLVESTKKNIKAARELEEAEQKLAAAQRYSQKIQLDYQKQAEKLRQQRDDESKSISERIKANEELGKVLAKQINEESNIAKKQIENAQLRIKLTGKSKENLEALAEAETKLSDIQERISGQESEQLANLNSLRKEAADKQKEIAAQEKERKLKILSDNKIIFETEKHTVEEQLTFYENYYKQLDKLQGGSDKVKNAQDLSAKILEIAKNQINDEIEAQSKIIDAKKEISKQEQTDLLANAQFLKDTETKRINESILNEKDKSLALEEIQKGYLANVEVINKTFEESEKARKEEQSNLDKLAFEMKLLDLEEQGYAESELKRKILEEQLAESKRLIDEDLANKKITADEATAYKLLEDKKYAQATAKLDKEVAKTKREAAFGIAQASIQAAQNIFGESKGLAVASALINTYQGITAELSTKAVTPYEIGLKVANVALVATNGFAAVRNILSTDKGSSGGGSSNIGQPSSGQQTFSNPAKTETVATLQQAPQQEQTNQVQTVLVLETLDEVKNNQQIKINSK